MVTKSNFYILSGGPGSGKSSVLTMLAEQGFLTVPEVARQIIQEQHTSGGNAHHHGDREAFLELMLYHSLNDYQRLQHENGAVFFDRGIPDLYGYAKHFCRKAHPQIHDAIKQYRYCQTVFLFPPWKEIYCNDTERQQDFAEASQTYLALRQGYEECGYRVVDIPLLSVEKRAAFLLQTRAQIIRKS